MDDVPFSGTVDDKLCCHQSFQVDEVFFNCSEIKLIEKAHSS